ncbi:TetR/AcrR family transcriptional regulator [Blastococcus xanthinilyticus]|uniref:TetR family transcriptional regulator n=1 Tax=Blastococcus xanthinilyticus TaxID=1564164 RepID=A0A5S5CN33_9ACTN|nr:TetR/AcrR family transcriptional regulator [Blastococcus xanthinilyticus]TYP83795.1 TetR family transcriptional regulator [Blastococcus xanthinilyticus]
MPARDLRADLVAAAARLLERTSSVDGISLRAVAREAGVTAPAVYGHFADLEELLDAVLDEGFTVLAAAVTDAVDRETDPAARLVAGCLAYVRAGLAAPGRYRAMFGRRRVASGASAFALLVDGVAACVHAGRSASQDPQAEANLLWTALHGVVTLRSAAPEVRWPELEPQLRALVTRLALLKPGAGWGDPDGGAPPRM